MSSKLEIACFETKVQKISHSVGADLQLLAFLYDRAQLCLLTPGLEAR